MHKLKDLSCVIWYRVHWYVSRQEFPDYIKAMFSTWRNVENVFGFRVLITAWWVGAPVFS